MGIDYGTGGAKACIINTEGKVLAYAFREYPIITKRPGWSEHNPHLYWEIAKQIIEECINQAQIDPRQIRGIGTSSALPSTVMVDKNHEPIHLAYNLMDRRATNEVKWLKENIGEDKIFELTGNRLNDHPLIVNLMWERNNRLEFYQKIYKALTVDGFIRLKLTGKATVNSRETYVTVSSTITGVQLLRYTRDTFSQLEMEMGRVLKVSSYDILNLEAEKINPGSDALVVLPYFMGGEPQYGM